LVEKEWFENSPFFRSVEGFLMQFGISPFEKRRRYWEKKGPILDDPKIGQKVKKYTVAYAGGGKDSRTTQLWIALNPGEPGFASGGLGQQPWETPIGEVIEGTKTIDALYKGYGDMPPWGKGPDPGKIQVSIVSYRLRRANIIATFR
jgi:cyclophilin family peptidyl-prolyl cis-trans isomerase